MISKKTTLFYPFFRISTNSRKGIEKVEKETFAILSAQPLKLQTINARNLLKSYQTIHSLINNSIKF